MFGMRECKVDELRSREPNNVYDCEDYETCCQEPAGVPACCKNRPTKDIV